MRTLTVMAVAWTMAAWPSSVIALRCGNELISVGDPEFRVKEACGPPTAIKGLGYGHYDYQGTREIWYYDLGPNRLLRILHFRNGRLRRIETERRPEGLGGERARCTPSLISRGMTELELLKRCGEPDQRERYHRLQPFVRHGRLPHYTNLPPGYVEAVVEDWYYAFGERYLDRRIRLVNGRVTAVDIID